MKKRIIAVLLILILTLTGCSGNGGLLPETEQEKEQAEQSVYDKTKPDEIAAALECIFAYRPEITPEMKERMGAEQLLDFPVEKPDSTVAAVVTETGEEAVRELLAEFAGNSYYDNAEARTIGKIFNGNTGEEINGGNKAMKTGESYGYWRITNCNYYNSIFFSDEQSNTVRLLYRCKAYHYILNDSGNLAEARPEETVLTTENTEVVEYDNAFVVIAIDRITSRNLSDRDIPAEQVVHTGLMYESYDDALKSFTYPEHEVKELLIPKGMKMTIMDGYKGKPIVVMPQIVGKYIDVSNPENVLELDELEISNYKVEWVDNNEGQYVSYSIISCSVEPGEYIDITDMSKDSRIIVQVASKSPVVQQQEPVEDASAEEPAEESAEG